MKKTTKPGNGEKDSNHLTDRSSCNTPNNNEPEHHSSLHGGIEHL